MALGACRFETQIDPDAPVKIPDAPPGAWLDGFAFRKPIQINRTTGATALADFPVGILFASDSDLAARARDDGRDIVVTLGDAMTPLDTEVVGFSGDTGALEAWARVPMLAAGMTVLYVYYGGAPATTNAIGVFPAARFKGVWHLSDAGANAADSTMAAHTLTATGTAIPGHVNCIAGRGRSLDGMDDQLLIADPADGSLDVGMQSFSYSAWINSTAAVGMFDNPFFKGGTSPGSPGYCMMTGTQNPWLAKLHDGTNYVELALIAPMQGAWLHVAMVVDRAATPNRARTYVNGVMTDQQNITLGTLDTARELSIGNGAGGAPYNGLVDEVRIYNTAVSDEWLATEHANLATPGFLVKGGEEPKP